MIKTKGKLMEYSTPKVMGVLNLTPDSYYAKSRSMEMNQVVEYVGRMIEEGVDILDMGAMSTRPGAEVPSISEEMDRLIGPLMAIRAAFPEVIISIDTYRTEILKACLDLRIDIVNDISGGRFDTGFLELVASSGLPYILMHAQGVPATMQNNPKYDNLLLDVLKYFDRQIHLCRSLGIKDLIIDPGFGFGKTIQDNYKLLSNLSSLKIFDLPILVGISRKSMIYKVLESTPEDALIGTSALHMLALQNGGDLLRVHDVKEAKQCIQLYNKYKASQH